MARRGGNQPEYLYQTFLVTCGATDQNNLVDGTVPCAGAQLVQAVFTTKTAGTGTGTFGVQILAAGVNMSPASATTLIDADAAASTVHGTLDGFSQVQGVEGARLSITTVKSGTVSGDAVLIVGLIWRV